jgi:hypothetical protein
VDGSRWRAGCRTGDPTFQLCSSRGVFSNVPRVLATHCSTAANGARESLERWVQSAALLSTGEGTGVLDSPPNANSWCASVSKCARPAISSDQLRGMAIIACTARTGNACQAWGCEVPIRLRSRVGVGKRQAETGFAERSGGASSRLTRVAELAGCRPTSALTLRSAVVPTGSVVPSSARAFAPSIIRCVQRDRAAGVVASGPVVAGARSRTQAAARDTASSTNSAAATWFG